MKSIMEVIIVEGRHDSERLKKYFDCDTIETGGTSLNDETMALIKEAYERRGIIVFTDPDSPGNRIRERINQAFPGSKNAFVDKHDARTEKKVGVEHAEKKILEEALNATVTYSKDAPVRISSQDMYDLGLSGRENSGELRSLIGKKLHIGDGNAKTMRIRLNCLGITKEELIQVIQND